jgi:catechol 2,3-dioxygenase-like lactoylglutathione lyase family enzyme
MDMKLEVVVLPVSDVDRAKRFYEKLGFRLDIDYVESEEFRVLQFTPPGSGASIIFGKGITSSAPGSVQNLHLIVSDIEEARADLVSRGVDVSEVFWDAGGTFHHHGWPEERVAGRHPEPSNYRSFASFSDPDGNGWVFQEVKERLPGRVAPELLTSEMRNVLLEELNSAAAAHGVHEKEIGKADPDWPQWYADHMARSLVSAGRHLTGFPA